MDKAPAYRQFFGDAEREFRLTPELILELERKTEAGIGGLCKRLFAGDFHFSEVTEIIRLALIGGGETPKNAAALIGVYVNTRPLFETFPLAVAILEVTWFGNSKTHLHQSEVS